MIAEELKPCDARAAVVKRQLNRCWCPELRGRQTHRKKKISSSQSDDTKEKPEKIFLLALRNEIIRRLGERLSGTKEMKQTWWVGWKQMMNLCFSVALVLAWGSLSRPWWVSHKKFLVLCCSFSLKLGWFWREFLSFVSNLHSDLQDKQISVSLRNHTRLFNSLFSWLCG